MTDTIQNDVQSNIPTSLTIRPTESNLFEFFSFNLTKFEKSDKTSESSISHSEIKANNFACTQAENQRVEALKKRAKMFKDNSLNIINNDDIGIIALVTNHFLKIYENGNVLAKKTYNAVNSSGGKEEIERNFAITKCIDHNLKLLASIDNSLLFALAGKEGKKLLTHTANQGAKMDEVTFYDEDDDLVIRKQSFIQVDSYKGKKFQLPKFLELVARAADFINKNDAKGAISCIETLLGKETKDGKKMFGFNFEWSLISKILQARLDGLQSIALRKLASDIERGKVQSLKEIAYKGFEEITSERKKVKEILPEHVSNGKIAIVETEKVSSIQSIEEQKKSKMQNLIKEYDVLKLENPLNESKIKGVKRQLAALHPDYKKVQDRRDKKEIDKDEFQGQCFNLADQLLGI